jgi:hypothetical protein
MRACREPPTMATYVAENREIRFDYQGEDTSLVGIWANESGLPVVRLYTSTRFDDKPKKCRMGFVYTIGHQVTPSSTRQCYRAMDESVVHVGSPIK